MPTRVGWRVTRNRRDIRAVMEDAEVPSARSHPCVDTHGSPHTAFASRAFRASTNDCTQK